MYKKGISNHQVIGWVSCQSESGISIQGEVGMALPSGKRLHNYWKIHHFSEVNQLEIYKWAISNSYVSLLEAIVYEIGHHNFSLENSRPFDWAMASIAMQQITRRYIGGTHHI